MATAVTVRADFSADELRRLATASKHANQSLRLLSLAAVLDGMSRADAARIGGMDRQTLRDWVHRYNERGPEGLKDSWSKGHPPRLTAEQLAELAQLVETGPERAVHGMVRWRRMDLQQIVASASVSATTSARSARSSGSSASGGFRCGHAVPIKDAASQEANKKTLPIWLPTPSRACANDKPIEIWWQDEARIGQQGTLTRVWAERGSRPRAPRDQRYEWAYLFGAVCPARDAGVALVLP